MAEIIRTGGAVFMISGFFIIFDGIDRDTNWVILIGIAMMAVGFLIVLGSLLKGALRGK